MVEFTVRQLHIDPFSSDFFGDRPRSEGESTNISSPARSYSPISAYTDIVSQRLAPGYNDMKIYRIY